MDKADIPGRSEPIPAELEARQTRPISRTHPAEVCQEQFCREAVLKSLNMFGGESKAKPTRAPVVKAQLVCCEVGVGDMEGSKVDTPYWKDNI